MSRFIGVQLKMMEATPRIRVEHNWFTINFGDCRIEGLVNGPEHRDTPEHKAVCGAVAREKAAYVVRCINSHDTLLAALKSLRLYGESFDIFRDDVGQVMLSQVDAALAAA